MNSRKWQVGSVVAVVGSLGILAPVPFILRAVKLKDSTSALWAMVMSAGWGLVMGLNALTGAADDSAGDQFFGATVIAYVVFAGITAWHLFRPRTKTEQAEDYWQ